MYCIEIHKIIYIISRPIFTQNHRRTKKNIKSMINRQRDKLKPQALHLGQREQTNISPKEETNVTWTLIYSPNNRQRRHQNNTCQVIHVFYRKTKRNYNNWVHSRQKFRTTYFYPFYFSCCVCVSLFQL